MSYMVTFTSNIPPMLAYIPYMDPMGYYPKLGDPQVTMAFWSDLDDINPPLPCPQTEPPAP